MSSSCACSWTWAELLDGLLTYNTVKLVKVRDRRLGALKYLLIFSLALYSASRCPRRLCSFASSATRTGQLPPNAVIVFKMLRDTAYVNSVPLRRSLFFVAPLPLTSVENRPRDERPSPAHIRSAIPLRQVSQEVGAGGERATVTPATDAAGHVRYQQGCPLRARLASLGPTPVLPRPSHLSAWTFSPIRRRLAWRRSGSSLRSRRWPASSCHRVGTSRPTLWGLVGTAIRARWRTAERSSHVRSGTVRRPFTRRAASRRCT